MAGQELHERPLRSVLYCPASNARVIDKARGLACDALFLDLEDAVAPEKKAEARSLAVAALAEGGFADRLVMIRCNGLDTEWGADDWSAAIDAAPDAILAPKIGSAEDVQALDRLLARAPAHIGLWAMIETAAAIVNLREIAACAATTRLQAFVVGTNDLSLDLRCRRGGDRAPLAPALAMAVAAARANGLLVFDGVYNDFGDTAGFEAECRQGVDFGFDGKTLIHPSQIEACNRLFSPPPETVAWAKSIVAAFATPEAKGKGAISLDGRMVERLHLTEARRVLKAAGEAEGAQV